MTTPLEALQNAFYNLNLGMNVSKSFVLPLARSQLHNAIVALEKGYGLHEDIDFLSLDKVEDLPDLNQKEA